ncbi:MAG: hypothetical protein COA54_10470 [Thiotrichaceae bacterium]|nr:MAG: hypothetical protein COA54_10470 [Thiotrichaceae bacterium]
MQLKEIDKSRYSKHLKIVFAGIAIVLLAITLAASTIIIQLFGTEGDSHFWFNLAGVVIAAATVVFVLTKLRHHPFMFEVAYVWDLKQILNKIYRKQKKIEEAMLKKKQHDAMIIMNFQYRGSKQLYELDDNTITMVELNSKIKQLDKRMLAAGLSLSTDAFDAGMLDKF